MGDAAGELADRLQLLRVPKHLFGLAEFGTLDFQPAIGFGELARAFGDQQFQALVQPAQRLLGTAHPQQGPRGGQQFLGFDRLHQKAVRPAIQRGRAIVRTGHRGGGLQHHDAGMRWP